MIDAPHDRTVDLRLREKQKLRRSYGLRESELKRLVHEAMRSDAPADRELVELLERRLDTVVFRSGFAPTILAARQLVSHGHVFVNDRRVDIPSFRTAPGDVVTVGDHSIVVARPSASPLSVDLRQVIALYAERL